MSGGYGGSSPREISASLAPDTMAPSAIGRQARELQESLLDLGDDAVPGALRPERVPLSRGAWLDVQRGWLSGSAALFCRLAADVPWRAERRRMYDRTVDVPRLLCIYGEDAALPDPALDACRDALNAHYAAELGEE